MFLLLCSFGRSALDRSFLPVQDQSFTSSITERTASMRLRQSLGITFTAVILLLCGCGNSGSSANPPKGLSYSAGSVVYTKGVAITPDNPASSGGAVSSYSVSPALPAGLILNSTTGVISGTPTVVSAMASYTVTASDLDGSTTTTLSITVNDQPPTALSYGAGTSTYTINTPITPNAPASSGGTVISYSVNPALPAGLSLSTTTGVISGTPAMLAGAVAYTVTATNSGGSATASVTIAVNSGAAPPLAAPAGLAYHPAAAVYTMDVQIPGNAPTSTGGPPLSYKLPDGTPVPAYSIFPDLPLGLRLSGSPVTLADSGTGVISGTPLVTSGPITYTVTASNPAGSTTAPLTITVNAAGISPSGLAYGMPAPVYVAGTAIATNAPLTNPTIPTGSAYSVSPDLPAGLSIDAGSGAISGTPLAVPSAIVPTPPSTTYHTVTVTTAAGSTSAPLTITIYDKPQGIPNMAQWITPLETTGASFQYLDTGMVVTDSLNPQILPKEWLAGQAVSTSISPDGSTLLVLTSGFNRVYQGPFPLFDPLYSSEYIFIFDITNHTPVFTQAVPVPNAYHGIVWDPVIANHAFYVSGGMGDAPFGTDPIPYPLANNGDNIHIVQQQGDGTWKSVAELGLGQSPYTPSQGHPSGNGLPVPNNQFASVNSAVFVAPMAAGLAISPDGRTLVVANYFNDSITVFTGGLDIWKAQWVQDADSAQGFQGLLPGTELDLRPARLPAAQRPAHRVENTRSGWSSKETADPAQPCMCRAFASARSTWCPWERRVPMAPRAPTASWQWRRPFRHAFL